ncbi:alpha-glucosidase/alpha-galactosidase, partial [Pseudomonas syringae]
YEMLTRLGYFVTESSEHFAEYTPYFIKEGRPDLIEKFGIPHDEYPKRCIEQIERGKGQAAAFKEAETMGVAESRGDAASIMNSVWTGEPSVIYGNLRNNGCITSLPENCAAEMPCLVDQSGIQPTHIGALPPQLTALIRTNINVQELT